MQLCLVPAILQRNQQSLGPMCRRSGILSAGGRTREPQQAQYNSRFYHPNLLFLQARHVPKPRAYDTVALVDTIFLFEEAVIANLWTCEANRRLQSRHRISR